MKYQVASLLSLAIIGFVGCSAQVNESALQGRGGAPLVSQVAEVIIPFEPRSHTAVVAIESVTSSVVTRDGDRELSVRIEEHNSHLSQKLVTALAHTGNISVVDMRGLKAISGGGYSVKLSPGEEGPYLVKAVLNEFTEKATENAGGTSISLGWVGVAAGIAGLATGKPGLGWSGLGVALADPKFDNTRMHREGMVGFDIQIVDGRTLRVLDAFTARGTFAAEEAKSGFSLFGYADTKEAFAQSVMGQATQAAMNDAVQKIRASVLRR